MNKAGAFGIIAAALWLAAGHAAVPPGPPDAAPVLRAWDAARRRAGDWHQKFTVKASRDDLFLSRWVTEVSRGEVSSRWPDRLRVEVTWARGCRLLVVCKGCEGSFYNFEKKEESVWQFPRGVRYPEAALRCGPKPSFLGNLVEGARWLVLGPPTRGLDDRFHCRLEKEDARWSYLVLEPKKTGWWWSDQRWRVVLHRKNRWLRQVSTRSNREQFVLDFEEPSRKPLPESTWEPPFKALPEGWKRSDDSALRKLRGE